MEILYQDPDILVCVKPQGVLSTDEPGGMPDLLRQALGDASAEIRTVHRLDRVVGGLMLLARSRETARVLSAQVADGTFEKEYLAVLNGVPEAPEGKLRDLLYRDRQTRMTRVVQEPGKDVKEAILTYRVLGINGSLSLAAIRLETGRTHQIRVQFASRGLPLVGDKKYGKGEDCPIALWSHALSFHHPRTGSPLSFRLPPPGGAPWELFQRHLFIPGTTGFDCISHGFCIKF